MSVPAIVKFSTRQMAETEIANHARYVRWTLPYTWRVDVIGTGRTGNFGAVAYPFAHGGAAEPISLYRLMRSGDLASAKQILGTVFHPENKTWYGNAREGTEDLGTYLSTDEPYFRETKDWRKKEVRLIQQFLDSSKRNSELKVIGDGDAVMVQIAGQTIDLKGIANRIFGTNWKILALETICHGDMNAENIMVKEGSYDFSFIDFQATGWHHRARDFCSIEGSIRAGFPVKPEMKGFAAYFEREVEWLKDEKDRNLIEASVGDDRSLIGFVRRLFLENFGMDQFLEIVLANFVHSWWLSIKGEWSPEQRDQLLATTLATYQYLLTQKKLVEIE